MAANDINAAHFTGNVVRDAKLNSAGSALNFTVASNSAGKDNEQRTDFIPCVIFGKGATALQKYLTKGKEVTIHGRLRSSSFEQDGNKRSRLEVVADRVKLHGGGRNGNGGNQSADEEYEGDEGGNDSLDLEDVPF